MFGGYENLSFAPLKDWISAQWRLKGNLRLSMLGGFLILLLFELKENADKVLREGLDFYSGKPFFLDRWNVVLCRQKGLCRLFYKRTSAKGIWQWVC